MENCIYDFNFNSNNTFKFYIIIFFTYKLHLAFSQQKKLHLANNIFNFFIKFNGICIVTTSYS